MRLPSIRTLPVLLAAALLASCDAGPTETTLSPASSPLLATSGSLQKIDGTLPQFAAEAVIGPLGGSLGVPGYRLVVPPGAVVSSTRFTFQSLNNGYVEVRLTATSLGSSVPNDVGAAGFAVPLWLELNYGSGGQKTWQRYVVAWARPDGVLEEVPSTVDQSRKVVVGRISHFSLYAAAGGD